VPLLPAFRRWQQSDPNHGEARCLAAHLLPLNSKALFIIYPYCVNLGAVTRIFAIHSSHDREPTFQFGVSRPRRLEMSTQQQALIMETILAIRRTLKRKDYGQSLSITALVTPESFWV
jgi:hypothetical protein